MYVERFYAQGPIGAAQVTTAAADIAEFIVPEKCQIDALQFTVKVAVTVTAAVITFYSRTVVGSNASQVSIGTITLPIGAAAGATYVNQITPIYLNQGQSICASVTTTSTAGSGYSSLHMSLNPENPSNESNVVVVTA
jgi:hypothetical protein